MLGHLDAEPEFFFIYEYSLWVWHELNGLCICDDARIKQESYDRGVADDIVRDNLASYLRALHDMHPHLPRSFWSVVLLFRLRDTTPRPPLQVSHLAPEKRYSFIFENWPNADNAFVYEEHMELPRRDASIETMTSKELLTKAYKETLNLAQWLKDEMACCQPNTVEHILLSSVIGAMRDQEKLIVERKKQLTERDSKKMLLKSMGAEARSISAMFLNGANPHEIGEYIEHGTNTFSVRFYPHDLHSAFDPTLLPWTMDVHPRPGNEQKYHEILYRIQSGLVEQLHNHLLNMESKAQSISVPVEMSADVKEIWIKAFGAHLLNEKVWKDEIPASVMREGNFLRTALHAMGLGGKVWPTIPLDPSPAKPQGIYLTKLLAFVRGELYSPVHHSANWSLGALQTLENNLERRIIEHISDGMLQGFYTKNAISMGLFGGQDICEWIETDDGDSVVLFYHGSETYATHELNILLCAPENMPYDLLIAQAIGVRRCCDYFAELPDSPEQKDTLSLAHALRADLFGEIQVRTGVNASSAKEGALWRSMRERSIADDSVFHQNFPVDLVSRLLFLYINGINGKQSAELYHAHVEALLRFIRMNGRMQDQRTIGTEQYRYLFNADGLSISHINLESTENTLSQLWYVHQETLSEKSFSVFVSLSAAATITKRETLTAEAFITEMEHVNNPFLVVIENGAILPAQSFEILFERITDPTAMHDTYRVCVRKNNQNHMMTATKLCSVKTDGKTSYEIHIF